MPSGNLEFWIVSLPLECGPRKCVMEVEKEVKRFSESWITEFHIPSFRIGTLDQLMIAADDLKRLNASAELLLGKLVHRLETISNKSTNELEELLKVGSKSTIDYLESFKWEPAKYPLHMPIKAIVDLLEKQIVLTETEMNRLCHEYIQVSNDLELVEKNHTGPLQHRDVSFLVKKEDFVLDSEYLVTILVVVPKSRYAEWYNCYERIDTKVVPRSTFLLLEDEEQGLFTVTIFKTSFEKFRNIARELRFHVKNFIYDEERIKEKRLLLSELQLKRKKLLDPLEKWLNTNFAEIYKAMAHILALRVAVECVLRYGVPANFQAILIAVSKKDSSKLYKALEKKYEYIDESLKNLSDKTLLGGEDVPFVYFKIATDIKRVK